MFIFRNTTGTNTFQLRIDPAILELNVLYDIATSIHTEHTVLNTSWHVYTESSTASANSLYSIGIIYLARRKWSIHLNFFYENEVCIFKVSLK